NPIANTIGFSTGSSERARIDASGNVGIGTTSPQAALDVFATATYSAILVPRDTTANRPATAVNGMIRYNSGNSKFEVYEGGTWINMTASGSSPTGNSGAIQVSNGASSFLSNNNIVVDTSNGRIGIGTTTPSEFLNVNAGNLTSTGIK